MRPRLWSWIGKRKTPPACGRKRWRRESTRLQYSCQFRSRPRRRRAPRGSAGRDVEAPLSECVNPTSRLVDTSSERRCSNTTAWLSALLRCRYPVGDTPAVADDAGICSVWREVHMKKAGWVIRQPLPNVDQRAEVWRPHRDLATLRVEVDSAGICRQGSSGLRAVTSMSELRRLRSIFAAFGSIP